MHYKVTSLFVGNLERSVTPDDLYELFSVHGGVVSTYVSRDKRTKVSRGYGFVNFFWEDEAADAIKKMNLALYRGRYLRVMYKADKREDRFNVKATVLLQNLHPDVRDGDLIDSFKEFGTVLRCKVVLDIYGNSKCYGFVAFEDENVADTCVRKLNGREGCERTIYVTKLKSRIERIKQLDKSFSSVFIKSLSNELSENQLMTMCQKYGQVESVSVGRTNMFAVVTFFTSEGAETAVKELNNQNFEELNIKVSRAKSRSQINDERQKMVVYLTNISQGVGKTDLEENYPELKNIKQLKTYTREKDTSKNYAFAHFESVEQASAAMDAINKKKMNEVTMLASYANPKVQVNYS